MLRSLILLLASSWSAAGQDCRAGYALNDDGTCNTIYTYSYSRNQASQQCAKDGATLVNVPNAFANTALQQFAQSVPTVWIGMTCLDNTKQSCMFDDGSSLSNYSYTNFNKGVLNTTQGGSCVFMNTKTGIWYNADCSFTYGPFVCSYRLQKPVVTCTPDSVYFQGSCYYPVAVNDITNAQETCNHKCGELTSIHSSAEDVFVADLAESSNGDEKYMLLGLQSTGSSYNWTDGTPYDYKNFGYENVAFGPCVAEALVNDVVPKGKWINSACAVAGVVAVCKKNVLNSCDTTTARPSISPPTCPPSTILDGTGVIYSPAYPFPSPAAKCEYLISEPNGLAYIDLTSVNLDLNSFIYIYNYFMDAKPVRTITNGAFDQIMVKSNSSVMKMVYETPANTYVHNTWQAGYGDQANLPTAAPNPGYCNGGRYFTYGNITSPYYPSVYPKFADCYYYMKTDNDRIEIKFNMVDLAIGDSVTVYDGYGTDSYVITTLNGTSIVPTGNYTSDGIWMTVRFTSGDSTPKKFGFQASFWSI